MKTNKFSKLFYAAMAALLMTGCNADDYYGQPQPDNNNSRSLTIEVTTSDVSGSRASYSTGGGTAKETFVAGDEIGVYGMNGSTLIANNVKFTLTAQR